MKLKITLKAARVNANITQKEAAHLAGVSQVSLIKWERGERPPKANAFLKLCSIYGVTSEDIFLPSKFAKSELKKRGTHDGG